MRTWTQVIIALMLLMLPISAAIDSKPTYAQSLPTLIVMQPVNGEISSTRAEQRWTFSAKQGQRLSLRIQATSGDLEPYGEILSTSGKVLASSNSSSLNSATIDAFAIPDTTDYIVRATRAKSTPVPSNGAFTVSLLPGFSFLLLNDPSGMNAPMRTWRDANSMSHFVDGKLELSLTGENSYTWTNVSDRVGIFRDLYMQADVEAQGTGGYWEAGLMLRGTKHEDGLNFYIFLVNSDSKWKVSIGQPGGLVDLTNWQPLPFIAPRAITLAMLIKDNHFDLFYDGQFLNEIADDTLNDAGTFGVVVGTGKAPDDTSTTRFENFIVTLPADEASSIPVSVPAKLVNWQRVQDSMLEELRQARLVPGQGKVALEIKNKAFVTNNTPGGIVVQTLAGTLSFTDLVYSADVTWESSNDNIACALELRAADDNNFTIVYFDRKGGYGIRQVSTKDGVTVSLYNLSDAINKKNQDTNRVTIIAIGNSLVTYINGTLIADLNVKQTSGGVRIAAYNYQRASSTCQFTNLWLRSFDK